MQALATYKHCHSGYARADDTFTVVQDDESDAFLTEFTTEVEENGKIPFLDCLVSRDNNTLQTIHNDKVQGKRIPTDVHILQTYQGNIEEST